MKAETCPCGRPVTGASLCTDCTQVLAHTIADISAHAADLDTIRAKQVRYGQLGGGKATRGREQPLIVDGRFTDRVGVGSQLAWDTRNTVTTWVAVLLDDLRPAGWSSTTRLPADTVTGGCAFLLTHVDRFRVADYGTQAADELTDLAARLARFVDRPTDPWYAGRCGARVEAADDDPRPAVA